MKQLVFLVFCLLSTSLSIAQNLDSGLILYYPFNGSAFELRGSGNNGSVNGAQLTTDRFGNRNSAYSFDGSNDYIKIGNRVLTENKGTISAWILLKDSSGRNPILSQCLTTSKIQSLRFTIWPDSLSLVCDYRGCATSSSLPVIRAKATIRNNTWMHVAVSSDGSNYKMYVDGVEYSYSKTNKPAGEWFGKICSTNQQAFIGRWNRAINDEYFNGKLDDIRIYDRALSLTEIQTLATEGQCFETVYDSIKVLDTIKLYDTFTVIDTVKVPINDTIKIYDTLRTSVTDTLIIALKKVGLNQNQKNVLKAFPNPTKGELIIDNGDYSLMNKYRIKVITSTGKTVFENEIDQQQFTIDLNQFGGVGLYFLQVYAPNDTLIEVKKLILE